jgi:hypothetical protein
MEEKIFWNTFLRSVQTEPRDVPSIRGISGLEQPTLGFRVDDKRQRVVIISADHDARAAALMQADVQSTIPDASVVVARPALISLPSIADAIIKMIGSASIRLDDFSELFNSKEALEAALKPLLDPIAKAAAVAPLNAVTQMMQLVQQLALIDFSSRREDCRSARRSGTSRGRASSRGC